VIRRRSSALDQLDAIGARIAAEKIFTFVAPDG
jgi:hypothetical protein